MKACGIVAEYNPLHKGHAYHIQKARELSGCDCIIAVMSGSFVQRGEPAAYDKFIRADFALSAGVDIVAELPAIFALQSAEFFARGAVRILSGLGCQEICFGAECADLTILNNANSLLRQDEEYRHSLKDALSAGKTFARARAEALNTTEEILKIISSPNNILAIEYINAIANIGSSMNALPILRIGGQYNDESISQSLPSARAIRAAMQQGNNLEALQAVPDYVGRFIENAPIADGEKLSDIILYLLRTKSSDDIAHVCGIGEGQENAFINAKSAQNYDELIFMLKSKRYTLSRIKRTLCCLLLGIEKELSDSANQSIGYARILAMKKNAAAFLKDSKIKIIANKRDMDKLSGIDSEILQKDILATDIQALCFDEGSLKNAGRDMKEKLNVRNNDIYS